MLPQYLHCVCLNIICLLIVQVSSYEDELPPSLQLVEGDSMYLSFLAEKGPLRSCSVVTPKGESVPLDPALGGGRVTYSGRGLSQGVCGLRADKVTPQDTGVWLFTATGQSITHGSTKVDVSEAIVTGVTRTLKVNIVDNLHILCGPEEKVLYCELISPSGESTVYRLKKCEQFIYPVAYRHAGTWTCRFLLLYQSIEGFASTIVNINTDTRNFVVGYNETDTEVNIFCSHPAKPIQSKAYCSMIPPNSGERMALAPGRGLSRFKFFGFAPYHCGVTIRKPLRASDYGSWLCELAYTSGGHKGGFVHVLKDKQSKVPIQPTQKSLSKTAVLTMASKLGFKCSVNSSLSYCWLQHPNGTVFSPNPARAYTGYQYYGEGYDFGECGIQLDTPRVSDSGQWLCGMGLLTTDHVDREEIVTKIDILVSDLPLMANQREVKAKRGDTVEVGCRTVHPQAVTYCRYWKPDRTGLTIDMSTNISALVKYQYIGQGLQVGDCSLRVTGVQEEDFGYWTCATTTIYIMQGGEISTTFQIIKDVEGISLAAGIGIFLGAAIVAGVITTICVCKNGSRLKKKNSDDPLMPSIQLEELSPQPGPSSDVSPSNTTVSTKRSIFLRRNQLN